MRFVFPVIAAGAMGIIVANELTYQRTTTALKAGIELTDARIAAAQVMQLLTDAETAQRGFLLTGQASELEPYHHALRELPDVRAQLQRSLQVDGKNAAVATTDLDTAIDAQLKEIAAVLQLAKAGNREAALTLATMGAGREQMRRLRVLFTTHLAQAAAMQSRVRVSIYDSLLLNRMVTAALTILGVLGLYLFLRELRMQDKERARGQDLLKVEVRVRTKELRHLARYLQNVREDERGYLARELHDELGGLLTAAKLDLARIRMRVSNDPELTKRLEHAIGLLNEGIAFKRRIMEDLRPSSLATLGLKAALTKLCADMEDRLSIPIHLELEDTPLNTFQDIAVYRLVQEAMTNIAKYASAKNVWVWLHRQDELIAVEVRDDGVGFAPDSSMAGHHGLSGMRFRAESLGGTMKIESVLGAGTRLTAQFPVGDIEAQGRQLDTVWSEVATPA